MKSLFFSSKSKKPKANSISSLHQDLDSLKFNDGDVLLMLFGGVRASMLMVLRHRGM